ncbi:MAG TPA: Asp-tRNA(Asn)/Glu-tRNA(Gln) amidotransferase subunit GatC [Acidimicrobiales bacterium]|nr:Asp-tRNA(Asn)/Glu-tRNA(Gln) amidotransferase subunit GatC [Acidimicrobiales bacterium]
MPEVSASFSRDDVVYVARLARLELEPGEVDLYAGQLASILDHVAAVTGLDTSAVPATAHPLEIENVLRSDTPGSTLARDEVLAQAPRAEGGRFRVPPILGEVP